MKPTAKPSTPSPPASLLIRLPVNERGLDRGQSRRCDTLQRKLLRPDLKPSQRDAARGELDALIAAPLEARERAWREAATAETFDLAVARGEGRRPPAQAHPLARRHPHPYEARALSQAQYHTAHCKNAYEARSQDMGSQMGAEAIGSATTTTVSSPTASSAPSACR